MKYLDMINLIRNGRCPVCGTDDRIDYSATITKTIAYQHAHCNHVLDSNIYCDTQWDEEYTLIGISNLDTFSTPSELIKDEGKVKGDMSEVKNVPELLTTILEHKDILPTLLGIDAAFDKVIAERLQE